MFNKKIQLALIFFISMGLLFFVATNNNKSLDFTANAVFVIIAFFALTIYIKNTYILYRHKKGVILHDKEQLSYRTDLMYASLWIIILILMIIVVKNIYSIMLFLIQSTQFIGISTSVKPMHSLGDFYSQEYARFITSILVLSIAAIIFTLYKISDFVKVENNTPSIYRAPSSSRTRRRINGLIVSSIFAIIYMLYKLMF